MTEDELVANYPRLYHMAHDGAWDAIKAHGLMSAAAIVDAYGVSGQARERLLRMRRADSVPLEADGLPGAVLRDQKPMSYAALVACLEYGITAADWYGLLNSFSFFWLSRGRVSRQLKARAYRDRPQTVLTVDTASLVRAHRERVRLSPINSGSTLFDPQPRGWSTFQRIEEFPFRERAYRPLENNVVELVVEHSVPDIADHVLAVHRVINDCAVEEVWRSSRMPADEQPWPMLPKRRNVPVAAEAQLLAIG